LEVGELYLQQRELVSFAERKISKESFCKSLARCSTFDEKLEEGRKPLLAFGFHMHQINE
jgi:hypothetical protein